MPLTKNFGDILYYMTKKILNRAVYINAVQQLRLNPFKLGRLLGLRTSTQLLAKKQLKKKKSIKTRMIKEKINSKTTQLKLNNE